MMNEASQGMCPSRYGTRSPPAMSRWFRLMTAYSGWAILRNGVRVMGVQHDPARTSLKDAPDPAHDDDSEWAELRVSAQANRVYETRSFDQQRWRKAPGRTSAIETIRNEVGYVPP